MKAVLCCLIMAVSMAAEGVVPFSSSLHMIDPAMDDLNKEWCYLAKSTVCIGVPYMPEVVQVTYDGAIYTRNAELCFFYGENSTPIMARQKTFLDGWIPVVQYDWTEKNIAYAIEIFSFALDGETEANTVQFARLSAENIGDGITTAVLASACRGSGGDYRNGAPRLNPNSLFELKDNTWLANGKVLYGFPVGAQIQAVFDDPYVKPFKGFEKNVFLRNETGLAVYNLSLKPGEKKTLDFFMPRVPVEFDSSFAKKMAQVDYDYYRDKTVNYWKNLLGGKNILSCPELRINDSYRAMTVHSLLGTSTRNGRKTQTDGLPSPGVFILSYYDMLRLYDQFGVSEVMRYSLQEMTGRQQADGLIVDTTVTHGRMILASHGQVMSSLATHVFYTQDKAFAEKIYPVLQKAVACIENDHKANANGLMRASEPFDAEMILGQYTSHNLWGLTGLRNAIRVARFLGKDADVKRWTQLHKSFEKSVLTAIDASADKDGYVPTGLYEFKTGWAARAGFGEYQTNQDWENSFLAWPCEVLAPNDYRVAATVDKLRKIKYREGIMTYRNGQHLHHYVTVNSTMQDVVAGRSKKALTDIYHMLLHAGSCHEAFENMVEPWKARMVWNLCPPPHCWGGSKIAGLIRNMFVFEYGGRGGLDLGERELYLFSVLSPDWAKPGQTVSITDALTELGTISAELTFTDDGANIEIAGDYHTQPKNYVLRIPYFVKDVTFTTTGGKGVLKDGWLRLTPDVSRVQLRWTVDPNADADTFGDMLLAYRREVGHWGGKIDDHPVPPKGFLTDSERNRTPQPLSFGLVRKAFTHEYKRRFDEYVQAGGIPLEIKAPAIVPPPHVSASAYIPGHEPIKAYDGNHTNLASSWQNDSYPAWLKIDLDKVKQLSEIHVYPYWGLDRYYQYTVEISEDATTWHQVGDKSKNTIPSTPAGDLFNFAPIEARYIRVNMLYHNLNKGVHVVEIEWE